MVHLSGVIADITRGDAYQIPRFVDIAEIDPETLSKAWFTVKRRLADADEDAVIQKSITTAVTDEGSIDNIGASSPMTDAHLFFLLTPDDTRALKVNHVYFYTIKVLSSGNAPKTIEGGRLQASEATTQAES